MHVGELLRDHGLDEAARWQQAVEDHVTLLEFLAEVYLGAPGAWADQAACKGHGDAMFPTKGQSAEPAKRLCASCPVIHECSEWVAMEAPAGQGGVVAGLSERQRRRLGVFAA